MSSSLPIRASYEQLRKQAKDLHRSCKAGDADAVQRLSHHHPDYADRDPAAVMGATLSDAQFALARELDFGSWPRLKRSLEEIESVAAQITQLQAEFRQADDTRRQRPLEAIHDRRRLIHYRDGDEELSDEDARLLIANREGYALWSKYDSFIRLDPLVKDVITAIRVGDLTKVKEILETAPEVANPRWVAGYEPLESDGRPEIPNDSIPLFCVSEGVFQGTNTQGNEGEIAKALLDAGAYPDLVGQPMEGAVSFNCPRVVEALIAAGADIEGPAPGVFLAYPMLFGFTEVCEILAAAGARLDLRFAAGLGRLDEMERWIDKEGRVKPGPGLADPYMRSAAAQGASGVRVKRTDAVVLGQALLYACMHGRLEAAQWLVARGADVNALVQGTDVDTTVLHRLASYSHGPTWRSDYAEWTRLPVVRWLLAQGADPMIPDAAHGVGALHWAAHSNMRDMGRMMAASLSRERILAGSTQAQEGVNDRTIRRWRGDVLVEDDDVDGVLQYLANNPDAGDDLMETAAHQPDADGRLAKALIDAGVDPLQVKASGMTDLHTACSFNNVGVARVLLEAGADPNWQRQDDAADTAQRDWSVESGTPMEFATFFCYPRLIDLLAAHGGRAYNLPMAAAVGGLTEVRQYFLDSGALRNDAGARGLLMNIPDSPTFDDQKALTQRAFEMAVLHGRTNVVAELLQRDVDIHAAISVEYHGAEYAHLEKQNVHPFIWGTLRKHAEARGHTQIAELLRQEGALV